MPAKITPEKRAAIVADCKAGMALKAVREKHGVARSTLRNIREEAGVAIGKPGNPNRTPPDLLEKVKRARESGMTLEAIRQKYGVSYAVTDRAVGKLKPRGVKPRTGKPPSVAEMVRWNAEAAERARAMPMDLGGASSLVGQE